MGESKEVSVEVVVVVGGGGGKRKKVQTGGRQSVSGLYCYSIEGSKTVILCNDLQFFLNFCSTLSQLQLLLVLISLHGSCEPHWNLHELQCSVSFSVLSNIHSWLTSTEIMGGSSIISQAMLVLYSLRGNDSELSERTGGEMSGGSHLCVLIG